MSNKKVSFLNSSNTIETLNEEVFKEQLLNNGINILKNMIYL